MKTSILVGLALAAALLAPATSAHVVVAAPDENGECQVTEIGRRDTGPHASAWVTPCGPIFHTGGLLP